MPLMTWELWLARDIVTDNPLPWQKSLDKMTHGRVAQAMGSIFAVLPVRLNRVESPQAGRPDNHAYVEFAMP